MRRVLLLSLGILVVTWLEFQYFPGHTYLQSDTQIYLPILERLDTPGFLSRDLVAVNPHVTYTIYDEVTLFLHEVAHLSFERALVSQQILYRVAGVWGVFLIAETTGIGDVLAFTLAALVNLGAALLGPAVLLVEYEPVPRAFAFGLMILAIGLLAHHRPMQAGLAGALSFLYHPPTAAPFWAVVLLAAVCDRYMRPRARPILIVFLIGVLLLANLAQLQPGVVESQSFFGRIAPEWERIQRYRSSYIWVSVWAGRDIWHYLFLWVCGIWAAARIWPVLNRPLRWFFVIFPVGGILSVPFSYLALERLRLAIAPELQPARALLLTTTIASLACGIAGLRAAKAGRLLEGGLFLTVVLLMPMRVRLLDVLRLADVTCAKQLAIAVLAAGLLSAAAFQTNQRWWRALPLLVPVACLFVMPMLGQVSNYPEIDKRPTLDLAKWAEQNTWGSSMFLFPDAGRALYPGIFRAESRRALWTDWKSGGQANFFETLGLEWWNRWQQTMDGPFSAERLQKMLDLPIDYYVLKPEHRVENVKPVFDNQQYEAYDAEDLRNAPGALRLLYAGR